MRAQPKRQGNPAQPTEPDSALLERTARLQADRVDEASRPQETDWRLLGYIALCGSIVMVLILQMLD
jgi:hypothetical protein